MAFGESILKFFGLQRSSISTADPRWLDFWEREPSLSGVNVSRKSALSVPAVYGAIRTVSETLASLPFDLYEKTETGAQIADRHPAYYVTKYEPAPFQTGFKFRAGLFAQACFGDAYARIYRNGVGRPIRYRNLDRDNVKVLTGADGSVMYHVTYPQGAYGETPRSEVLFPWEILHIPGLTLDGLVGVDVIDTHKETFGMAIAATQYGSAFFGNGAHLSGVIEVPGAISPDDLDKIRKRFADKYSGVKKTGSTAVLDGGMKYSKIGLSPQEATLNDSRTFQRREIATVFGIPLHLIQDLGDSTFNNVETMSTQFVTICLRPWAVKAEQEFWAKTLTDAEKRSMRYFYRLNLNGLLRGDTTARTAMYKSGIESGWLLRNDARELEDLNRLPGLDKPLYPANMNVLDEDGNQETIANEQVAQPQADQPAAQNQNDITDGTPQASA